MQAHRKYFSQFFFIASLLGQATMFCVLPAQSESNISFDDKDLERFTLGPVFLANNKSMAVRCGKDVHQLFCDDGTFVRQDDVSVKVNINTLCEGSNCFNSELKLFEKSGEFTFSDNCYRWAFAGQICSVMCGDLRIVVDLSCDPDPTSIKLQPHINWALKKTHPISIILPETCPSFTECYFHMLNHYNNESGENIVFSNCQSATVCEFKCGQGFEVSPGISAGNAKCENGVWNISRCIQTCKAVPGIPDGMYTNRACSEGTWAQVRKCPYICDHGFEATKKFSIIKCDAEGQWESGPYCQKWGLDSQSLCDVAEVMADPQITVSGCKYGGLTMSCHVSCKDSILDESSVGIMLVYSDNANRIESKGLIFCNDQRWDQIPRCLPVCRKPPVLAPGVSELDPGCEAEPHLYRRCEFSCESGRSVDGIDEDKAAGVLRCLENGEWEIPVCEELRSAAEKTKDEIELDYEKSEIEGKGISSAGVNKTETGKANAETKWCLVAALMAAL